MKIGNIELDNNLVLAPMAGITDKTYRGLAKSMGVGLVFTEMVSAKGLYHRDPKTNQLMAIAEDERPVGLQIFGSDPDIMAEVVRRDINHREDIDILDINMGCPAPKIVKNNDGSALMRDPELVSKIVHDIVEVSKKPVTVKIRIGWDNSSVNGIDIARRIEREGASCITVHGRTREMYYGGNANWDYIGEMKTHLNIPLIGNGDIFEPEDAIRMLQQTKCDGVALGRGAMGNPWIFDRILRVQEGRPDYTPTDKQVIEMIILHLNLICQDKTERIGVPEMRKHISWYLKGMPDAKKVKDEVNRLKTKEEVIHRLRVYLRELS